MADRLARHNLPHPSHCPLCNQENEDIQHLLTKCVFARQFWHQDLAPLGLDQHVPRRREASFVERWRKSSRKVHKNKRKGLKFIVILGAWSIWKHRNKCVFIGASPSVNQVLQSFNGEKHLWVMAGGRGLPALYPGQDGHVAEFQ
ncbi:hypothetical protein PR202_gb07972 [Eleusine coracana subsp. coracana]|uniref:Reverse transcriptase zinc-binding domain-containing protein n=1 Tax=Eleusine coracana subsp. coracana TaxID=191504 RepID=A0AAV5EDM3_ELECO|nr:hypothetical protein PR202_gb07972 [Eleusine coracana subsp. coracana]